METCNILGVDIAVTNMKDTVEYIDKNLERLKGNYICVSNVHTTVMAYEDEEYRKIQNGGAICLPDGGPLSTLSIKRGFKGAERVTGPDLMDEIFTLSQKKGYTHYFYGSTDENLNLLKNKLMMKYPKLNIVGMYSPPFKDKIEIEKKEKIDKINSLNVDFLWVGLGAPKQEKWMYEHKNKIGALMIGVGAGFDYFSGNINRAPKWMQNNNLEWFYRLIQEPKRLFKRYMKTNTKFIWNAMILRK